MKNKFLENYFKSYKSLISADDVLIKNLEALAESLVLSNRNKKKAIIIGNGGSAAIASHFSVDLTKNAKVRCVNFNEPDLITCFANDFGFDNWMAKAIDFYGDEGDILIGISSSGQSNDVINACKAARENNFNKIITFSGFQSSNPLRACGDLNFWINSKAYNFVENIHQLWLLSVVDLIIGKAEYSA